MKLSKFGIILAAIDIVLTGLLLLAFYFDTQNGSAEPSGMGIAFLIAILLVNVHASALFIFLPSNTGFFTLTVVGLTGPIGWYFIGFTLSIIFKFIRSMIFGKCKVFQQIMLKG